MKKSTLLFLIIASTFCIYIYSCTKDENGSDSSGSGGMGFVDPSNCWRRDSITNTFVVLSIFLFVDSGPHKNHFYVETWSGGCGPAPPNLSHGIGTSDGPFRISYTINSRLHYGSITDTAGYKKMTVYSVADSTISYYYSE